MRFKVFYKIIPQLKRKTGFKGLAFCYYLKYFGKHPAKYTFLSGLRQSVSFEGSFTKTHWREAIRMRLGQLRMAFQ